MHMEKNSEITIVIPAKNEIEKGYLGHLLDSLVHQDYPDMRSTPITIAEAGNIARTREFIKLYKEQLNIAVIEGGLPYDGRNRGAAIAVTKYVLFIDADIEIQDSTYLRRAIAFAEERDLWCVGAYIHVLKGKLGDHILVALNNLAQTLSQLTKPYATGMFLLFNREKFEMLGGFVEGVVYAEDVFLVQQVPRKKFAILSGYAFTSNRRFVKMGRGRVLWLALLTVWNQMVGNTDFFYKDHHYFD